MKSPSLLIVAGELSGDLHAARILRAMRAQCPTLQAWGIGGDHLAAAGMDLVQHCRDMAVMGVWEVLKRYGFFRRVFRRLLGQVRERKPDAILLVDYPGFNLRFAKAVKHLGIPVLYYICPQVWAWKASRIPAIAANVDLLVALFPFEPAVFAGTDLDARYLGHPLVDDCSDVIAADWPESPRLLLVPGSRPQEIARLLPPMLDALEFLRPQVPGLSVRLPVASPELLERMQALEGERLRRLGVQLVDGQARELMRAADAALVTSGTATLEAALLNCPMVVVYKTSALTYAIGRRVLKVPHIGLVNLVAGRELCPELIQEAASGTRMAEAVLPLLQGGTMRTTMLSGLGELREVLASDHEGRAPADAFLELVLRD